jgi:hypothetical protein
VLNGTIHMPVLTWLYKRMTVSDEFPDGVDLTPLDLFCLVAAIPCTVIYKAVKSKPPFPEGAATDAIINAKDLPSLQQAFAALQPAVSSKPGLLGHGETGENVLDVVGSIAATVGAVVVDLCIIIKSGFDPNPDPAKVYLNKVFSVIQAAGFMGYVLPDMISGVQDGGLPAYQLDTWFNGMNNLCTYLSVPKAVIDASSNWWPSKTGDPYSKRVSPALDFTLNVIWEIPTIFQLLHQVKEHGTFVPADINAIIECVGGTAFDLSGFYSPCYATAYYDMVPGDARDAAVLFFAGLISGLNLIWAGSCLATTFDGLPIPS